MLVDLNRNDLYWISIKRYLYLYLVFLTIFFVGRVIFTFYFAPNGVLENNVLDVLYAFYMGWRYDTIIISYLSVPYLILNFFIVLFKSHALYNFFYRFFAFYFYLITFLVIAIIVCDLGFYSFFQDHLNILFFGLLEDDTKAIFESIWKNYPVIWLSLPIITFFVLVYFFMRKNFSSLSISERGVFTAGGFKLLIMMNLTIVLLAGGLRGGYNWYVLSPKYNDFSKHQFINSIALNGFITFEKAIKLRHTRNKKDFKMYKALGYKNIQSAFRDYLGEPVNTQDDTELIQKLIRSTPVNERLERNPPHVIMLLAESFGGFWLQYDRESFNFLGPLKKHFEQDIFFENFLASNNGTIGSLITLQSTIPDRPGQRYLSESSEYMLTPLTSSVNYPFSQQGYETNFIYGGKLAWRDIGRYFRAQKYDNVIGENYIVDALKLDGDYGTEWGIYDEHIYNYLKQKISQSDRPQFFLILTTSNHPPFQYPKSFKVSDFEFPQELDQRVNRERDLFSVRFKSFKYANSAISNFIDWFKSNVLKDNMIFAMTGDHNFFGFLNYEEDEQFLMHSVPFYLYLPADLRPESYDKNKLGSHEDIFATIYPRALSNARYLVFGEDLLSSSPSVAINSKIYANEKGMYYRDKAYQWNPLPRTKSIKNVSFPDLLRFKNSMLSVASYYLNYMKKQKTNEFDKHFVEESDQQ